MAQVRAPFGAVPVQPDRQVAADCVPLRRASRVIGAVQAIGADEQLVRVELVHHERHVEVRAVAEVQPILDELVREEHCSAVGEAVQRVRDTEVRAVDVTSAKRQSAVRAAGARVDEHLPAVTAGDVEPRLRVDRLALRAVVLRAAPEALGGGARRNRRNRCDRRELGQRGRSGAVTAPVAGSTVPFRSCQSTSLSGRSPRTAAAVRAVPDAAVVADQDVARVRRVEGERVEVRVEIPAEVQPGGRRRRSSGRCRPTAGSGRSRTSRRHRRRSGWSGRPRSRCRRSTACRSSPRRCPCRPSRYRSGSSSRRRSST